MEAKVVVDEDSRIGSLGQGQLGGGKWSCRSEGRGQGWKQ